MNAPKEYYPAGYDKNFDDNFSSKIDLPATSFHCGDQKHFPGLYGDQDLGCMVSFQSEMICLTSLGFRHVRLCDKRFLLVSSSSFFDLDNRFPN